MINVHGEPVEFKHFNDGTLRLNATPIYSFDGVIDITWLYDNDEEMTQLYFLVNHFRQSYQSPRIILNLAYIPNARMDRVKSEKECFTLKYFCQFINDLNFEKVIVFDPHSNVATALLDRVEIHGPYWCIHSLLNTYPSATLAFVDEGGYKRYKDMIDDHYFIFGVKDRDWSSQNIKSMQILGAKHMIAGHDILIVDDIVSRGSSLYLLAKQLKEMGAENIYAWISHCEDTVLQPHINGQSLLDVPNLITKIYTTNSIYRANNPKIEVVKEFRQEKIMSLFKKKSTPALHLLLSEELSRAKTKEQHHFYYALYDNERDLAQKWCNKNKVYMEVDHQTNGNIFYKFIF